MTACRCWISHIGRRADSPALAGRASQSTLRIIVWRFATSPRLINVARNARDRYRPIERAACVTWLDRLSSVRIQCMQISTTARTFSRNLSNSPLLDDTVISSVRASRLRSNRGLHFCGQLPVPVQRRQVLQTTSLGLLSSWFPFSKMSAAAEFHSPGDKWWLPETVAVVTGGERFAAV